MTAINGLMPPVAEAYEAMLAYIDRFDEYPTNKQTADVLGKAQTTVSGYMATLEARGYLIRPGRHSRGFVLTGKPWVRES